MKVDFDKKSSENEGVTQYIHALKANIFSLLNSRTNPSIVVFSRKNLPNGALRIYIGTMTAPKLSHETSPNDYSLEILPDGTVAIPLTLIPTPAGMSSLKDEEDLEPAINDNHSVPSNQLDSSIFNSSVTKFSETSNNFQPEDCIFSFLTEDGCHYDSLNSLNFGDLKSD